MAIHPGLDYIVGIVHQLIRALEAEGEPAPPHLIKNRLLKPRPLEN